MGEIFLYGNQERNKLGLTPNEVKYDYDETFFLDMAKNNSNSSYYQIISEIKENTDILDVGCANGLLGFLIKQLKNCRVDGIEYDKELYEIAKKQSHLDNIFNLSILEDEEKIKSKLSNKKYDFIIFGDVLEHLDEPWKALINVYDLLKDDGKIIVSIPNICNYDIIKGLINGEFNYGHLGILDTTHVKFFTASSFAEMIENISTQYNIKYDVLKKGEVIFTVPYKIDDSFSNLFMENGILEKNYFIMQNIFVLNKTNKSKIKISGINNAKNNYEKIVKKIENMELENKKLNDKISRLQNKLDKLELEKQNLENDSNALYNDYQSIINSKGWKLLSKYHNLRKKDNKKGENNDN